MANLAIFKISVFSATFLHEITLYAIDIDKKRFKTHLLTLQNHFERRPSIGLNFLEQLLQLLQQPCLIQFLLVAFSIVFPEVYCISTPLIEFQLYIDAMLRRSSSFSRRLASCLGGGRQNLEKGGSQVAPDPLPPPSLVGVKRPSAGFR